MPLVCPNATIGVPRPVPSSLASAPSAVRSRMPSPPRGTITSPDFVVTPEMRNTLYERMAKRGITINRSIYDAAEPLVSRILGAQIARYALGPEAEFARGLRNDRSLAVALQLLNGVKSQRELLDRAATLAARDTTKAK